MYAYYNNPKFLSLTLVSLVNLQKTTSFEASSAFNNLIDPSSHSNNTYGSTICALTMAAFSESVLNGID